MTCPFQTFFSLDHYDNAFNAVDGDVDDDDDDDDKLGALPPPGSLQWTLQHHLLCSPHTTLWGKMDNKIC